MLINQPLHYNFKATTKHNPKEIKKTHGGWWSSSSAPTHFCFSNQKTEGKKKVDKNKGSHYIEVPLLKDAHTTLLTTYYSL